MLYKSKINGIVYKAEPGYCVIINSNGMYKVCKKDGILSFNYIDRDAFETALLTGNCHVYHIHSFKSAFDEVIGKS